MKGGLKTEGWGSVNSAVTEKYEEWIAFFKDLAWMDIT
jgi:hypothetical protein